MLWQKGVDDRSDCRSESFALLFADTLRHGPAIVLVDGARAHCGTLCVNSPWCQANYLVFVSKKAYICDRRFNQDTAAYNETDYFLWGALYA